MNLDEEHWIQYLPHSNCTEVARFLNPEADPEEVQEVCEGEGESEVPWYYFDGGGGNYEIQPGQWIYRNPKTGLISVMTHRPRS